MRTGGVGDHLSSGMRDAIAAPPSRANGMTHEQTKDSGLPVSRIVASAATIGEIDDETVMAANVATQTHVTSAAVGPNGPLLITSADCSDSANSRTNGLAISAPASAAKKIPALLSGSVQRSANEALSVNDITVSAKNVVADLISMTHSGLPVTRPISNAAAVSTSAVTAARVKGTLPTSTQ